MTYSEFYAADGAGYTDILEAAKSNDILRISGIIRHEPNLPAYVYASVYNRYLDCCMDPEGTGEYNFTQAEKEEKTVRNFISDWLIGNEGTFETYLLSHGLKKTDGGYEGTGE